MDFYDKIQRLHRYHRAIKIRLIKEKINIIKSVECIIYKNATHIFSGWMELHWVQSLFSFLFSFSIFSPFNHSVQYKYWHDLHLYKTIYSYFFFCIKYILPCYVFFYNNPQFIKKLNWLYMGCNKFINIL